MTNPRTIAIASDHGGFELKEQIRTLLEQAEGITVQDEGVKDTESVDYPDYARKVTDAVTGGQAAAGILVCGTGIGMSIAANKVPGIRAALCHNEATARLSREHNDANVLVLGGRVLESEDALQMVRCWLATPFEGGRHQRRVDGIHKMECS